MKSVIQKLKNCEGCKRRRTFLKQTLFSILGFFMLPHRTQATDCRFLICPNGEQAALCCDSGCTNCVITESSQCITLRETCGGESTIYGVCCPQCPPHCPNVAAVNYSSAWPTWKITFDGGAAVILTVTNPPDNFNPMQFCKSGRLTMRGSNGSKQRAIEAIRQ